MVGEKAFKSKLLIYVCVLVIGIMSFPVTALADTASGTTGGMVSLGAFDKTYSWNSSGSSWEDVNIDLYQTYYLKDINGNDFAFQENKRYRIIFQGNFKLESNAPGIEFNVLPYIIIGEQKFYLPYGFSGWYDFYIDTSHGIYSNVLIGAEVNFWGTDDVSNRTLRIYTSDIRIQAQIKSTPITDSEQQIIDELEEGNALQSQGNTLQSQGNALQSQGNALQSEANDLQEEANETQKNIFEKMSDFFDNFFTRLGDFLLGLIVPSSDDLTAFLNEVNDWFSERLGFIWYPFSFAVDAVSALAGGTADTGITVPALTLNMFGGTYTIWNEMQVDLDAFGIFRYVRLFTSFICVGGIVALAYNKWDEWIGGHGVG